MHDYFTQRYKEKRIIRNNYLLNKAMLIINPGERGALKNPGERGALKNETIMKSLNPKFCSHFYSWQRGTLYTVNMQWSEG